MQVVYGPEYIDMWDEEGGRWRLSLEDAMNLARELNAHFAIRNRHEFEHLKAEEERTFEGG